MRKTWWGCIPAQHTRLRQRTRLIRLRGYTRPPNSPHLFLSLSPIGPSVREFTRRWGVNLNGRHTAVYPPSLLPATAVCLRSCVCHILLYISSRHAQTPVCKTTLHFCPRFIILMSAPSLARGRVGFHIPSLPTPCPPLNTHASANERD